MKIKLIRSLLILAVVLGAALGTRSVSRAADPIKVGGGFALTGDESVARSACRQRREVGRQRNQCGGWRAGSQIDLIVRDSKYQMDVTAQIAKQFVEEDKVVAVVGFTDLRLRAGLRPDHPESRDAVHHRRRNVAQTARTDRRS